ncbi:family 16 glycosylhydrolase [Luteolibacter algae]|uniref:Family 16 glycosylhydrolase n=1 Tax=Luteolibacter algae TaxID=454151 RepID=A0ABW5DCB2_9BACT
MNRSSFYFATFSTLSILTCASPLQGAEPSETVAEGQPRTIDLSKWELAWQDEFDYDEPKLDEIWESQNGPNRHILCSRWRENVSVKDGILYLTNRKEKRAGQEWTSGSIWTKKQFKYGYFECRYRYAAANATNNSFWLMTKGADPTVGKRFELDINEGHFPNEVNTNIHNWSDITIDESGRKTHPSSHKGFLYGVRYDCSMPLEIPVTTRKLRFKSKEPKHFHLRNFRIFNDNDRRFPDVLDQVDGEKFPTLIDHAKDPTVKITGSGLFNKKTKLEHLTDGNLKTAWTTQTDGEKWVQFEWPEEKTIGAVQFLNGWQSEGTWTGMISQYDLQYEKDGEWVDISSLNVKENTNFADEFHTYGLEWNEDELVFYFDRKEIRRTKNEFSFSEAPIYLSLAIIAWSGTPGDEIDGTSMKVDYVRHYLPK